MLSELKKAREWLREFIIPPIDAMRLCDCPDCLIVDGHAKALLAATEPIPGELGDAVECVEGVAEYLEEIMRNPEHSRVWRDGGRDAFCIRTVLRALKQQAEQPEADPELVEQYRGYPPTMLQVEHDSKARMMELFERDLRAIRQVLSDRGERNVWALRRANSLKERGETDG